MIQGRTALVVGLVAALVGLAVLSQAAAQLGARQPRKVSSQRIVHLKEVENRIFKLTNEARRKNGLPTLDRDDSLGPMARAHSDDMIRRDFFGHVNPDGLNPAQRLAPVYESSLARAGENIWGGHGHDYSDPQLMARMIVDGWMSSPGHRRNILNPSYTHLGVGVSARDKEIRATQLFLTRK